MPTACSDGGTAPGACDVLADDGFFPQSVASGDPKPDSVVLWTRLVDRKLQEDLNLALVVALDAEFTQLVELASTATGQLAAGSGSTRVLVTARAEFDHCVKVKVSGLSPGTTYYYQFYYTTEDRCYGSRVGRTRTAPAPDADVPVRFAFVSCQDYIGRHFNAYAALARQELDFVVHLGDYIYETTGDPGFQDTAGQRKIAFSDVDGALELTAGDNQPYHAAKSLSNYRDLYKTYRTDRALQRVHELFPMIVVWDDHEFSDDSHGATASYFNGRQDEKDEDRRKAANQAWFEYMPVDYPAGDDFQYDSAAKYPADLTIYRDFTFGKHLHLVMTDLRSYRADHLIPEDAFPGKVIAQQETLRVLLGEVPDTASPYLDIDSFKDGLYRDALQQAATALGFDPNFGYPEGEGSRLISTTFINMLVTIINEGRSEADQVPPLTTSDTAGEDMGYSYLDLGKTAFYSEMGSRYVVVKDAFDAISRLALMEDPERDAVMGATQEDWFLKTMAESTSTWKVWGNEYCLSQLAVDLTGSLPEPFKRRFYLSCDGWDGFRSRRDALIEALAQHGNVVAITGDIHAFLAGTPAVEAAVEGDPPKKIVEFVGSSVSSTTLRSLLLRQVKNHPVLKDIPMVESLANGIDGQLVNPINPYLGFSDAKNNGFCVAEVSSKEFVVSMHMIPESALAAPLYQEADAAALEGEITIKRFKTKAGEADLYMEDGDAWKKWDPATLTWV
ncbi:alkaline phosphatase D family protein [Sorangium cellulosum]|uniref:alkaline phosphatase D family protein n=1 Tax=Sorangium cellulosum TaxID=56 RepID=UPI001F35F78E|nr:alkaline phosphatase D family protein [Sorangium cellulosum]